VRSSLIVDVFVVRVEARLVILGAAYPTLWIDQSIVARKTTFHRFVLLRVFVILSVTFHT
jgi:hypothetical protein